MSASEPRRSIDQPLLLAAVAVLAVLLLGGWFGVMPAYRGFAEMQAQRDLLASESLKHVPIEVRIEALETEVADIHRRLEGHEGDLQTAEVEAHVIGALQELSWRHDVQLGGIAPARSEPLSDFERRVFEVSMSARYFDLVDWFADLEQQLGFAMVESFKLNAAPSAQSNSPLRVRLQVVAYRAPL